MPSILGKEIGDTAYGLMGFTWRPYQTPDEDAFPAMKVIPISSNQLLYCL
jgi:pyridoxine 4-dehydrogenase